MTNAENYAGEWIEYAEAKTGVKVSLQRWNKGSQLRLFR
jgi:hypothetical protein